MFEWIQLDQRLASEGYQTAERDAKYFTDNAKKILDPFYRNYQLTELLGKVSNVFENRSFDNLEEILVGKQALINDVSESIEKQVGRIRTDETSPKNTTLYFSLLLETKDLLGALMNLLQTYEEFHLTTKEIK